MAFYGGGSYGSGSSSRREEKEDMKRLNDRLAQYINKVRNLADTDGVNSQTFLNSFRTLEDEINALRGMYERELDDLRKELADANREKNKNHAEAEKFKKLAQDLDDRQRAEQDRNRQLMSELGDLQHRVNQLERDLSEARQAAKGPTSQLSQLQSQFNAVDGRNQELERRLGDETVARKAAEDKANQLQKKLDFNEQLHDEKMKDAADRLEQSAAHIRDLESRAKELEKMGASYPELLEQMREKLDQELNAYKNEIEENNRRNMQDMKARLDSQGGTISELRAANAALQADNDKLQDKIRTLEGLIKDLQRQKAEYEDLVNKERKRGAEQVRAMEKKLKDLQDLLFARMQEANADKDVNLSLRAEIEAMKVQLADEEKRLKTSLTPAGGGLTNMNRPQLTPSYSPSNRLGNVSSAKLNDKSKYMYSGADAGRSQSSMGNAGGTTMGMTGGNTMGMTGGNTTGGTPGYLKRPKSPLSEYMDSFTYRNTLYRTGGGITARGGMNDSLPKISGGGRISRQATAY